MFFLSIGIISCAGGSCLLKITQEPRPGDNVLAVSAKEDYTFRKALKQKHPTIRIINTESLMLSILQQQHNFTFIDL